MARNGEGGLEVYRAVVAVVVEAVDEALVTDGLSSVGACLCTNSNNNDNNVNNVCTGEGV